MKFRRRTIIALPAMATVAGAAHGSYLLVVLGLLISIPIVVWGSTLLLKLTERYPVIVLIGAGVLAFTAVKMMLSEPLLKPWLEGLGWAKWLATILVVVAVVGYGHWRRRGDKGR